MLDMLMQGEVALFATILIGIVISLSFHEFGHAIVAHAYGDDTPQRQGRLTLNPVAHIDPMGLIMVALIGFGYARPVQTDPRKFRTMWGDFFVSAAGPGMNLLLAIVAINFFMLAVKYGWNLAQSEAFVLFISYFTIINLALMIFNLIPIGVLDGHYILPYFLPPALAQKYRVWNARYGNQLFLVLILLSFLGLPIFAAVRTISEALVPLITFVPM